MSDAPTSFKGQSEFITEPAFLEGSAGPLFCIRAIRNQIDRRQTLPAVLLVPPFAEEMNRSRRLSTKLRQRLLASEVSEVIMPDLYGTGDSSGDFNDARWQIWIRDLQQLAGKLRGDRGNRPLTIIGVRAGCLLIEEIANGLDMPPDLVVLVQPETSGYEVIQHLLRMRVASRRFSGIQSESTADLWRMFENGESVDVSGYLIHPQLALELKRKRLNRTPPAGTIGHMLELSTVPAAALSYTDETIEVQNGANAFKPSTSNCNSVSLTDSLVWNRHCLDVKPFWQLQEHEPEDELIQCIVRCAVPLVQ